jgi:hypothetical protein
LIGTPFAFTSVGARQSTAKKTEELTMIELRTPGAGIVSDELTESSRVARAGIKLIRLSTVIGAAKHLLALFLLTSVSLIGLVEPAFAQSVLNGDAQKPIRAIQNLVTIGLWVSLGLGIGFLIWAGVAKGSGKAWGSQAIGGAVCIGITGIIALVNMVMNGDLPDLGEW